MGLAGKFLFLLLTAAFFFSPFRILAQKSNTDTVETLTLGQCVEYAVKNQPLLQQSLINIDIARSTNKINLSGWLPQAYVTATAAHYLTLPTSFISDSAGKLVSEQTGVVNSFIPELNISQAIFSPSLLYAAKSAPLYIKQAQQQKDSTYIYVVANVSKSFYNLLATLEQVRVLKEDTARLVKNLNDTYHQYVAGIVDQTDYDEAAITLNNSNAQLRQAVENIVPAYATLKQIMGYPPEKQFNVLFDTLQMQRDIVFDTTQELQYTKRIEYQQLQTGKLLQNQVTDFYRKSFLPTVSGVFNYIPVFESNSAATLLSNTYPYSYVGLNLSLPLFTGFARLENIHKSKLQERLLDWDEVSLKSQINVDYTTSLANYKGNLYNFQIMKDNEVRAKRVYDIVSLQYLQGIVPYLNVITAESNLISSEIGYVNALFQLLSSKIDLEKAMGIISFNNP
jgi:outer membrane protein TolC